MSVNVRLSRSFRKSIRLTVLADTQPKPEDVRYHGGKLQAYNGTVWADISGSIISPSNTTFPFTLPMILS